MIPGVDLILSRKIWRPDIVYLFRKLIKHDEKDHDELSMVPQQQHKVGILKIIREGKYKKQDKFCVQLYQEYKETWLACKVNALFFIKKIHYSLVKMFRILKRTTMAHIWKDNQFSI